MNFLYWLEESTVGVWVAQSWGYPLVLSTHAVGMSIVVGTVIMFNLRLLGFAGGVPLSFFNKLAPVFLLGVILNVLSGLALFSGNPVKFFFHPVFWIKISLLVLGGLTAWWELHTIRRADFDEDLHKSKASTKIIAVFALVFWLAAIVAGRLIAYFKLF